MKGAVIEDFGADQDPNVHCVPENVLLFIDHILVKL